MPEDTMAEGELDRLWNDLVTGRDGPGGYALEPSATEAVRVFQTMVGTPAPQVSRDRVDRDVLDAIARSGGEPDTEPLGDTASAVPVMSPPFGANGSRALVPLATQAARRPQAWSQRVLAQFATAALLLLTLAAGFMSFLQGPPRANDEPIAVPALIATPDGVPGTPAAAEVSDKPLFAATFTADELPTGEANAVFYRITLRPGASLQYLGGLSCGCPGLPFGPGVGAEVVQSGEYAMRLDAPMRIQRGGASADITEIPAGTDITLGPGDVAVYPQYDASGAIRNTGGEPVEVIGVAIVESGGMATPPALPEEVTGELLAQTSPDIWQTLPAGPMTVSMRQLILAAGMTLGPYETAGLEALWVESGGIKRGFLARDESAPRGQLPYYPPGSSTSFLGVKPELRRILFNPSEESAQLLVVTIMPAGIGSDFLKP